MCTVHVGMGEMNGGLYHVGCCADVIGGRWGEQIATLASLSSPTTTSRDVDSMEIKHGEDSPKDTQVNQTCRCMAAEGRSSFWPTV